MFLINNKTKEITELKGKLWASETENGIYLDGWLVAEYDSTEERDLIFIEIVEAIKCSEEYVVIA